MNAFINVYYNFLDVYHIYVSLHPNVQKACSMCHPSAASQALKPKLHYTDLLWICCGFVVQLVVQQIHNKSV